MRRGSVLLLVLTLVFSMLAMVPATAVTTPQSDGTTFESVEAERVVDNIFKKQGDGVWIVYFDDAAIATYEGGVSGIDGTSNEATGDIKLDVETPDAKKYRAYLESTHDAFVAAFEAEIGRSVSIRNEYFNAANGVAAWMRWEEASRAARMDGVDRVVKDTRHTLTTDRGPTWIGAPGAWDGSTTGVTGTMGEGVIVGILDTGINPSNPSFAATGPVDAYVHTNPLGAGTYLGECAANPTLCNDKLIGIYSLVPGSPFGGIDDDGHGSHTASTAAGNFVHATVAAPTISENVDISGVAPHANIIAYDVCDGDGCNGTAILAGIDQAVADRVDVINYSIGSDDPSDPWSSADDLGFLGARAAGIFVAHSAGNEGPGDATVGSPMAPWMTHVAALTHDRKYDNALVNMTGGDTTPPPDLVGLGFTGGIGPLEIVYAGDYPADNGTTPELCGDGDLGDFISPWNDPFLFTNKIVVCDRGTFGRVEKGANVLAAGAAGFVLVDNGGGLSGDPHVLPGVHITQADGAVLKTWLATGTGHMATIQGASRDVDPANGDIVAGFSSRGPNRSADFIAPSLGAPGVDIIAAHGQDDAIVWDFLSGTSMASPHVAGVAALFKNIKPTWGPAALQSALMMTATRTVRDTDGTPAGPFDTGSGRVDIAAAANSGLVLLETETNYRNADPALGGDPTSLNLASMSQRQCVVACSWTRTFTSVASGPVTWNVSATGSDGMTLSVSPSSFTIPAGGSQTVTITADVDGVTPDTYHFGVVELTNGSGYSDAHLPVAVQPTTGSLPELVRITTARNAGSWDVDGLEALEITDFHVDNHGLVKADLTTTSATEDPTSLDIYDDVSQNLVDLIDVPAGTVEFIAEVTKSDAPDLDLFVGLDTNGDGLPSEAEELCRSATGTALESCSLSNPAAGSYWIYIQNWAEPASGLTHEFTYATALVPTTDLGNMEVEGPETNPQLTPFSVSVFWDLPDAAEGDRYYGAFSLGTSPGNAGNIGTVPVRVFRVADDVTKTADITDVAPGDTVTYTITVNPNVTNADLTYTVTDTIPEGMTYVDGSVTGGATVTDGVVEWSGVMASPSLAEMYYEPYTGGSCDTPFGGYVNLSDFGIAPQPGITGDTQLFSVDRAAHFYGQVYPSISFADDGFALFDSSNYGGAPWNPQVLPNPDLPNNLAAMLWNDFEFVYDDSDPTAIDGVSIATAGPYTIIEYDGVRPFFDAAGGGTDPGPLLDMEIILIDQVDPAGPEIVMAYDNVTPGVPGVVGVENANGTEGVTVAAGDTSAVISDGSVLCWDWVSPEFPAQVITYQVTVDEDAPHGTLTNSVTSVTDNPGDKATTTSVDADNTNLGHIGGPARDALDTVRGEISNLIDNRDPNEHWVDVGLLKTARTLLYRADRSRYWIDDDTLGRSGAVALLYMQLAASALEGVHSHASFDGDAELLAQSVAGIARGLAADAIDESSAHPYLITQAEKYLDKGDKDYDKGHFSQAVSDYRRAWSLANTSWGWGHRHW